MSSIADPSVDEAAIGAINDAAGYCRTLWATFIGYAATIFVLTSGTTHEALLRQTPVKLPLFNVESGIPLRLFYVIAPLLLVLFHLNLLMKLHDLRVRVSELIIPLNWTDEANAAFERSRLRRRLMAFDYAVLKAGLVSDRRERVLLRLVTDATIFIMPVLLLLFVQLQFLPYHDWKISWLQRLFVILDLGMIAYIQLWLGKPRGQDGAAVPHSSWNGRMLLWSALFAAPFILSLFVLAFPGEPQDVFWKSVSPRPYAPLAGGDVAEKFGIRRSLYLADRSLWAVEPSEELLRALTQDSTIIALHGVDDAGPELLRTVQRIRNAALSLRGRNLSYANFESSTLIAVDLSPDLNNEQVRKFQETRAAAAPNGNSIEPGNRTDMSGASFSGADLRGARLPYAKGDNAAFFRANLQSAVLAYGQFANANFAEARMQEADLYGARLQSASFQTAGLQGAILGPAQLQNADLRGAAIASEQLRAAQWDGARLDDMVMQQLKSMPAAQAGRPGR
ncbi:MAG TPA: pentapeptide repeat-containing protein [Micropepsaceae bacterium]|nr:pentapeptide repeat-containing protein [Micropepsaceae bacterium]